MYPFLKHHTEFFILENNLVTNISTTENVTNLLRWKFDFIKSNDSTLTFAVLGIFEIYKQDNDNKKSNIYALNAGRVFEIGLFNKNDNTSFKILEDCLSMVYKDLNIATKKKLDGNILKGINFPDINMEGFHGNLHLYFQDL